MTTNKNIPKLRFPEFKDEWEMKKLGDITSKTDKKNKNKEVLPVYSISNKIGFIPQSEQFEGMDSIDRGYDTSLYKIIENNTFAYNPARINVGSIGYNENLGRVIVSSLYVCFQTIEKVNDWFLNLFFDTIKFKNSVLSNGEGGVRIYLFYENFSLIPFALPTLPEQTRIASFFTSIDQKIAQLKQKKSLLEQYKKGVMQKLFSQELRFKDSEGNEFPEWEEKKLGEVFTFKITNSYSRENLNYEVGTVKNIHYGDIHTKFQTLFDVTKESVPFVNSEISIQKIADDNYCQEGDLILADASEDLNDVGKSIELVNLNNQRLLSGLHTILARPFYGIFASGFCGYLFKSDFVRVQIQKESQGSKVLSISATRLSNVTLIFPCIAEQTIIANFLSAIDKKINFYQDQIELTQLWKKGLLQQMFI
jgi:type I restriction enzyme S subunit